MPFFICLTDATSTGDAATLQNRLQNLGSTANSTGSAGILMEQTSSPQFNGTFGFGPVGAPPIAGSQRYPNYASSMQQQNNNYQNGESFNPLLN